MEIRPCKITLVCIHHSATRSGTFESIKNNHVNVRKYGDIGYNYVIEKNGRVTKGRDLKWSGAHNPGKAPDKSGYTMNQRSIGFCFVGNYSKQDEVMSEIQLENGAKIIAEEMKNLGIPFVKSSIIGHSDTYATECPGRHFPFDRLVNEILKYGKQGEKYKVKNIVLCSNGVDERAAGYLADFLKCSIAFKGMIFDADLDQYENVYEVGGTQVYKRSIFISGSNRYDTCQKVLDFIAGK